MSHFMSKSIDDYLITILNKSIEVVQRMLFAY